MTRDISFRDPPPNKKVHSYIPGLQNKLNNFRPRVPSYKNIQNDADDARLMIQHRILEIV